MTRRPLIKLIAFLVLCATMTVYMFFVLNATTLEDQKEYRALFANASQIKDNSPVRVAGVTVGRVDSITLRRDSQVEVSFSLNSDIVPTTTTRAVIRYKNLIGDRFVELVAGNGGAPMSDGGTIPASRTSPALDLDALLNGFTPLFSGLQPDQINQLATSIVAVLQGQSGTVLSLLNSVSSLTNTLADKDQLIGEVIDNLNTVLGTISKRDDNLSDLLVQVQELVSGLARDREPIGSSISQIQGLAGDAASLVSQVRPDLRTDINQLGGISRTLNQNTDTLNLVLDKLPVAYRVLARGGAFGNFFNFYLCGVRVALTGPDGKKFTTPMTNSDAARCT